MAVTGCAGWGGLWEEVLEVWAAARELPEAWGVAGGSGRGVGR